MKQSRIDVKTEGTVFRDHPGYYFGYGLESVPTFMEALLGPVLTAEIGVVAVNRSMGIQPIDMIPDIAADALGGKSARENVREAWAKYTTRNFASYVIFPDRPGAPLSHTRVRGTLYEIDQEQANILEEWDLASPELKDGIWRVWDHDVQLEDGRTVSTLTIPSNKAGSLGPIDGEVYTPYLNGLDVSMQVIRDVAQEITDRGQ